jgi:hypothetical protein
MQMMLRGFIFDVLFCALKSCDVISDVNLVTEGGFTRILQCRCRRTLRSEFQLNMKTANFLDASATIYQTTRLNIPEENDLCFV